MLELNDLFESDAAIYALVFGSIICILLLLAVGIITSGMPLGDVRRVIARRVLPVLLIITALGATIFGAAFTKSSGAKVSGAPMAIHELHRQVDMKALPNSVPAEPF